MGQHAVRHADTHAHTARERCLYSLAIADLKPARVYLNLAL